MQVDDTLNLFDELQMLHQTVVTKTKTLHDACDRLVCPLVFLFAFLSIHYHYHSEVNFV